MQREREQLDVCFVVATTSRGSTRERRMAPCACACMCVVMKAHVPSLHSLRELLFCGDWNVVGRRGCSTVDAQLGGTGGGECLADLHLDRWSAARWPDMRRPPTAAEESTHCQAYRTAQARSGSRGGLLSMYVFYRCSTAATSSSSVRRSPLDPLPQETRSTSLARRVCAQSVEAAADRFIVRPRIFLHLIEYLLHDLHFSLQRLGRGFLSSLDALS